MIQLSAAAVGLLLFASLCLAPSVRLIWGIINKVLSSPAQLSNRGDQHSGFDVI